MGWLAIVFALVGVATRIDAGGNVNQLDASIFAFSIAVFMGVLQAFKELHE